MGNSSAAGQAMTNGVGGKNNARPGGLNTKQGTTQ